jgi:autotransporter-associated beta strand protein
MPRPALSATAFSVRTTIIAGFLLASVGQPIHAQTTYSWTTAVSGNWNDSTKWTPTSGPGTTFPAAGDTATFNAVGAGGAEVISLGQAASRGTESAGSVNFANAGTTALQGGVNGGSGIFNILVLSGGGGITVNAGAGAVTIGNATGGVQVSATGNQTFLNNSSSQLTFTNNVVGLSTGNNILTFDGSGNILAIAAITDNTTESAPGAVVGLIKNGSGTLELDGQNTYTAGTTLNSGTMTLKSSFAVGNNTGSRVLTINGGTLAAIGSIRTIPANVSTTIGGDFTFGLATGGVALTFSGTINLGSSVRTITVTGNTTTFNGIVSGAGGGITKLGAATLTLGNSANSYSGPTTVSAGSLTAGTTNAFSQNSAVTVPSGGTLNLAGFSQIIPSLSDGGGAGGNVLIGNGIGGTLTLGGDNTTTTFSGTISGTATTSGGGLTKNGTGTFTLGSPTGNPYGSAASVTTVNNGTLSVTNTSNSATGPGVVTVTAGTAPATPIGTLGGTGTIAGPVTVNAGTGGGPNGVIQPGTVASPIGTLTLQNNLTLPGTYNATIDPTSTNSSLLTVTGVLDLTGGTSTLNVSQLPGTLSGATYILANFGSLLGTFTNTSLPSGYGVNYNSTSITISPVPEPACVLLACAGVAGGFGWWRRRTGPSY